MYCECARIYFTANPQVMVGTEFGTSHINIIFILGATKMLKTCTTMFCHLIGDAFTFSRLWPCNNLRWQGRIPTKNAYVAGFSRTRLDQVNARNPICLALRNPNFLKKIWYGTSNAWVHYITGEQHSSQPRIAPMPHVRPQILRAQKPQFGPIPKGLGNSIELSQAAFSDSDDTYTQYSHKYIHIISLSYLPAHTFTSSVYGVMSIPSMRPHTCTYTVIHLGWL